MDTFQDISFEYYEKKIKEFDNLLSKAKSQTLFNLIKKAKDESEDSLKMLLAIQKVTISYLSGYRTKTNEKIKTLGEHLSLCKEKISELDTLSLTNEERELLTQNYSNNLSELSKRIGLEANLNTLIFEVYPTCVKEFRKLLLNLIFKPETSQFHYESVIDVLDYIATKFIPGLEEVKMISKFPIMIRKKSFVKSGDKILIYFEEYLDVLDKWKVLANSYIRIVES